MGFFLLKVGPPLEKFSGSAPGTDTCILSLSCFQVVFEFFTGLTYFIQLFESVYTAMLIYSHLEL